eukprot:CAMPEP_0174837380 /NCGR_PEP_ID=MMETSP1114-20130205/6700_1 /TAXON_ID=312471 /ORGANISM="Neobodo designis, Strain CCAP 1951/1" /LENGTH=567 /DNA_ID=CAMNT_0016071445 /DNA_START=62 /DNA_END=1765 /DNA_ORIENTATION=+
MTAVHRNDDVPPPPSGFQRGASVKVPHVSSTPPRCGSFPPNAYAAIANFHMRDDTSEAAMAHILSDVVAPPLPMLDCSLAQKGDGRFAILFLFPSEGGLQHCMHVAAYERPDAWARMKARMVDAVAWVGLAARIPEALWLPADGASRPGSPRASDDEDDDDVCGHSIVGSGSVDLQNTHDFDDELLPPSALTSRRDSAVPSRQRSELPSPVSEAASVIVQPPASPTSTAIALSANAQARWRTSPAPTPESGATHFEGVSDAAKHLLTDAMEFFVAGGVGNGHRVERVVLSGPPSRFKLEIMRHISRARQDRSAPAFRYQHSPYSARPVVVQQPQAIAAAPARLAIEDVAKQRSERPHAGAIASSAALAAKRRTLCISVSLECGVTKRCKCDTATCPAPAVGDRVIVRVPLGDDAVPPRHNDDGSDDESNNNRNGAAPPHALRVASVTHVTSWSRKRAGNASAPEIPEVMRPWQSPDDDEHERTAVHQQASHALAAARSIIARHGMPVAVECAWSYHDLSCVIVRAYAADGSVSRRRVQALLKSVEAEMAEVTGSSVEWMTSASRASQ